MGQAQPVSWMHVFFSWNGNRFINLGKFDFITSDFIEPWFLISRPTRHAKRQACKTKVRSWLRNNWKRGSLFFISYKGLVAFIFNVCPSKVFAVRLLPFQAATWMFVSMSQIRYLSINSSHTWTHLSKGIQKIMELYQI